MAYTESGDEIVPEETVRGWTVDGTFRAPDGVLDRADALMLMDMGIASFTMPIAPLLTQLQLDKNPLAAIPAEL